MRPITQLASILMLTLSLVAVAPVSAQTADHRVAIHVDENDAQRMHMALNNAQNIDAYYRAKGESVQIEVVAYGPGLMMYVDGVSPVQPRVEQMSLAMDNIAFSACGNTHRKMSEKAGKEVVLLPEANTVPSGVVRLMELQEQGWSYVRP